MSLIYEKGSFRIVSRVETEDAALKYGDHKKGLRKPREHKVSLSE